MINPRRFLTIMTRTKFWKPRYYDIGVNFSDSMFQGYYNGSTTSKHPCDIQSVIERAHLFHVDKMLITALTIKESEDHFELCENIQINLIQLLVYIHVLLLQSFIN